MRIIQGRLAEFFTMNIIMLFPEEKDLFLFFVASAHPIDVIMYGLLPQWVVLSSQ